ncbi:hypothetical protein [Alloalcanivorax marinus]|uniref:hypothetical protein n=1 Tax=Alloalcanivorax marinus TaxID=1177169 RepID=UPI0019332F35|nr:hypothetical protein [Alloalcanivorax marinus]MBL7252016.1 hypothetical protein [Alloalcanivorax marinus]
MPIHGVDKPVLPQFSRRQKHCLHAYLSANQSPYLPASSKIKSTDTIAEDLYLHGGDPDILRTIAEAWDEAYCLPKTELDWISTSRHRQLVWLLNELRDVVSTTPIDDPTPHYLIQSPTPYIPNPAKALPRQRYDIAIATIDAWPIRVHKKRNQLHAIQQKWERSQLSWRKTKWLNGKDEEQLNWALEYLAKANLSQQRGLTFDCWHSQDTKDKHIYVLGFLDHLYRHSGDLQELFITKMRKTWSQKKYRESEKAKKQVYFSLSDEARQHLRQLEKARKQSKNRIIEDLLSQAVRSKRPG